MKVLVVEDNKEITELIMVAFRLGWPEVAMVSAGTGEDGVMMVEAESPDIVILDIGLPDMRGFEVLRRIRHFSDVPVIILTGEATTELEELKGFEAGADDYMLKPFRPAELIARVKNALSHVRIPDSQADVSPLILGKLTIDPHSHQMLTNADPIDLTSTEYRLLSYLAKNAGRVLTRNNILKVVWGEGYEDAGALKMTISRLRRKLAEAGIDPEAIIAIKGIGYKFSPPL